jgi:hypothetical protein
MQQGDAPMAKEPIDTVAITVRVEKTLRRQIEEAAKSSFRPLSSEIAYRLKLSFERELDQATAS